MKTCSKCKTLKPLSEYAQWVAKNGSTVTRSDCRDCKRALDREYARKNFAKRQATQQEWYKNNIEYAAARSKKWFKENPEYAAIQSKRWAEENPQKAAQRILRSRLKRAELLEAAYVEHIDRYTVYSGCNWICQLCFELVDSKLRWPNVYSASLDHIIPLSKGGLHCYENVQLAHFKCNAKKGNRQ